MSEKIRTATVRDIDNYLSDDAEVCAWEDVKNVLDAKNKEIAELNDKLQNVSSLLKETREWLVESQKLHKRCADNAVKVIAHSNYKRCLAMARWCDEVMMSCELRGYTVIRIWYNRHQWAMRWKYKWLELAEKFKEAK